MFVSQYREGRLYLPSLRVDGGLTNENRAARRRDQFRRPDPRPQIALPQNALDWFHARGITDAVLMRNRIDYGRVYFPQVRRSLRSDHFPVLGERRTRQPKILERSKINFSVSKLDASSCSTASMTSTLKKPLIWVEGECDKLALEVAGFRNCRFRSEWCTAAGIQELRIPFQFPRRRTRRKLKRSSGTFSPSIQMPPELGLKPSFHADWPLKSVRACDGRKESKTPTKCSIKHGADDLRWYIENAEPFPIEGVFQISDRRADLLRLYEHGFERGYSRAGTTSIDSTRFALASSRPSPEYRQAGNLTGLIVYS